MNESLWMPDDGVADLATVITPVYNRSARLTDALDSVAAQTYRPLQLIVVDDGSEDGSAEVAEAWAAEARGPGFEVVVHRQANAGAPSARNAGLARATGAVVQFLDSDDVLLPDKIERQRAVLDAHPEVGYVWSKAAHVAEASARPADPGTGAVRLYRGRERVAAPIQVVRGLFRREVCQAVGPWSPALKRYQDWEYNARAISVCRAVASIDALGYLVVEHDAGRISGTSRRRYASQILTAVSSLGSRGPGGYVARYYAAQALTSAAMMLALEGEAAEARRVAWRAALRAPWSAFRAKAGGYAALATVAPRLAAAVSRRTSSLRY